MIVIFTCMTSRAVYLEVAHSLTTDACINAIRCCICRRGPVHQMRSDNGTHFVGAQLREAWAAVDHTKIYQDLLSKAVPVLAHWAPRASLSLACSA